MNLLMPAVHSVDTEYRGVSRPGSQGLLVKILRTATFVERGRNCEGLRFTSCRRFSVM